MELSGSLHELHLGYEGSLGALPFPGGSVGDALFGLLYIPNALLRTAEFLAANFGSATSDDWT